ncbi:RTA1 domain-containing protein [Diaporthe helianthi]|uniref:RTA1 domain-containing protein n=1 Tax=Diaporthe helianthi TaxID=158607 RepID=A0A2P5HJ34_DIAHE|nr:RTA1 domain-containing protein [Diaporthe helianthi]
MSENGQVVPGSYWIFAPNKWAPVFFAAAFAFSGLWQVWQGHQYKCWHVTWHYTLCALIFTAGFITREIGAFHYGNLPVFIASSCLVYAAPPLYEAANYHILGRVLFYVPYHSPIHPGRVWTTFAMLASVVEGLSSVGASYSANQALTARTQDLGAHVPEDRVGQHQARLEDVKEPLVPELGRQYERRLEEGKHPRRYLPATTNVFLSQADGVTEVEGPGYKDGRSFLATLFDPFDFSGLATGRDKKDRFWEGVEGQTGQREEVAAGGEGKANPAGHASA